MSEKVRIVPTADGGYIRCGRSKNKPFCDDSHKRTGFKSREGDDTAHKPL